MGQELQTQKRIAIALGHILHEEAGHPPIYEQPAESDDKGLHPDLRHQQTVQEAHQDRQRETDRQGQGNRHLPHPN